MNAEALSRYIRWGRSLSIALAVPLALTLLVYPTAMVDARGQYSHGLLMLVMLGISAGFVHGVGFQPRPWVWRILLGPVLGWPAMVLGYGLLITAR